ncbi:MAG: DUF2190 family protein [Planctomycetota bacterium]
MSHPAPDVEVLQSSQWDVVQGSPTPYQDPFGNENLELTGGDALETAETDLYDGQAHGGGSRRKYSVAINLKDLAPLDNAGSKMLVRFNDITKGGLQFKLASATEYHAIMFNDGGGGVSANRTTLKIPVAGLDLGNPGRVYLTFNSDDNRYKAYRQGVEVPGTTVVVNAFGFVGLGQGFNHLVIGENYAGEAYRLREWIGVELDAAQVAHEFQTEQDILNPPAPPAPAGIVAKSKGGAGHDIDFRPSVDTPAGAVAVLEQLVGVVSREVKAGGLGALAVSGAFDFPKGADVIPMGKLLYWDATNQRVALTAVPGAVKLGHALAARVALDTRVPVRMIS